MSLFKIKTYPIALDKWADFAIGFLGWLVVNSLLWWSASTVYHVLQGVAFTALFMLIIFVPLPINVSGLIFLAIFRRWMALGGLSAFGLNLAITLAMGMFKPGTCFTGIIMWPSETTIPFFVILLIPVVKTMLGQMVFNTARREGWR